MHAQSHVHISVVSRDNFRIRKYIKQQNRFLTSLVLLLIINKILYSENKHFFCNKNENGIEHIPEIT